MTENIEAEWVEETEWIMDNFLQNKGISNGFRRIAENLESQGGESIAQISAIGEVAFLFSLQKVGKKLGKIKAVQEFLNTFVNLVNVALGHYANTIYGKKSQSNSSSSISKLPEGNPQQKHKLQVAINGLKYNIRKTTTIPEALRIIADGIETEDRDIAVSIAAVGIGIFYIALGRLGKDRRQILEYSQLFLTRIMETGENFVHFLHDVEGEPIPL